MIKIGVTGSISSGKSTFASFLSGRKYPVFNADKSVAEIYKDKSFVQQIFKLFKLKNKKKIKLQLKKSIEKNESNLKKLEKIIHPKVRRKMKKFSQKNKNKNVLIFDIPLLVESKLMKKFDITVFVDCKKETRLKRFIRKGGRKKIFNILNNKQMLASKKRKFCDYKINNNKKLEFLRKNAKMIINNYE